jgi:mono/diheme cytochrome c family protein
MTEAVTSRSRKIDARSMREISHGAEKSAGITAPNGFLARKQWQRSGASLVPALPAQPGEGADMKSVATRFVITGGVFLVAATMSTLGADQGTSQPSERKFVGSTLFGTYCATCHGVSAKGDGPLAANLRKPPANLTLIARRNGGIFSAEMVARIIDGRKPLSGHGGGDMPVWGDAFGRSADGVEATPEKIAALVEYLQSLQQKP